MPMNKRLVSRLSAGLAVCLLAATPLAASAQQLTVSAAASLTNAFKELAPKFEAANPGTTVRMNFGASGTLLQQIRQGAPADVFASADQPTMDRAAKDGLIDPATRQDFVRNSVVLIEPLQGGPGLKTVGELSQDKVKRLAIGKPQTVPVGNYTKQVLESAGLWQTLEPKYVHADNVRQVLDYVSRGEVDAGFVYRTDAALMQDKVKIVLEASGHDPVSYPAAVVRDSRNARQAQAFVAFLRSPAAQEVLGRYGFGKP